ncbi:methyltransferase domain-containing protein [Pricia sp. S334]|uniref:Methyltransferase domain-containing protein n=1 Tax=Pricia mediterranea TaxID=3076079 RepID=A0ABU3LAH7_9FLAO|nr:methyltransferase domain-containing protein [Pricia sp. S334]MDT7830568.1 methyltransferase domain-containing protein [Pricia sp. S334]
MSDFVKRNRDPELMDDVGMDSDILKKVLHDVDRTNRLLGGHQITLRGVAQLIRKHPQESYTIVDMGCGNGGMLREVVKLGRRMGVSIEAIGIDLSEKCLAIARNASSGFPEIQFIKQDILQLSPEDLHSDIVLCTLTMHHFFDENISVFLDRFTQLARIGVVINDLQRSPLAYHLFRGFSAIFIRTKIAKHDGLISIKSGFTRAELQRFAETLPSVDHDIKWKWAFRYVWVMDTQRLNGAYE